jgi:hypothetical protein
MRVHLVSFGPRYSHLAENILPIDKGAPLLESCFNCTLVTLVEFSFACLPWNHREECIPTLESSQ